jgi:predicted RNase H-like nuclease
MCSGKVPDVRVIGVDGCRGGWLAATVTDDSVTWSWSPVDDVAFMSARGDAVAVDIPMGLLSSGRRDCDASAKSYLGDRRATVFWAPLRCVLTTPTYADACRLLRERSLPGMSAQAYGIVRAVRAVDVALEPAMQERVVEAHPECSFAALGGDGPLPPKKSATGVARRIAALSEFVDVVAALADVPPGCPVDDALDALACAWTAVRWAQGRRCVLGGDADERGLVMRIAV